MRCRGGGSMKNICFLVALLISFGQGTVLFAQENAWIKSEFGSFKVERFWEETVGNYTCSYTIVTYRNTTQKTFEANVTIRASVYDSQKRMVDTNTRSFFAHEHGPIKPGFEGTVKIPVECDKGQAKSVSVKIDSAA
jgi:hypothetical protein